MGRWQLSVSMAISSGGKRRGSWRHTILGAHVAAQLAIFTIGGDWRNSAGGDRRRRESGEGAGEAVYGENQPARKANGGGSGWQRQPAIWLLQ